jgi:hypothetical protein
VGTFALRDGIPTPESINDIYDYLDFHNGVNGNIKLTPFVPNSAR